MPAPYSYDIQPPDMFGGFVSGLKLGAGIEELEAARLERAQKIFAQQKAQEQELMVNDLRANFLKNPTYESLQELALYQDANVTNALRENLKVIGEDKAKQEFELFSPAAFAFRQNDVPAGLAYLSRLIEASSDNPARKDALTRIRDMAVVDPNSVVAMVAFAANQAGFKELSKNILEKGKKTRVLSDDEVKQAFGGALPPGKFQINEEGTITSIAGTAPAELPTSVKEANWFQSATPDQQNTFKDLATLKAPTTKVEITQLEKGTQAEFAKLIPELYAKATSAVSSLNDLPRYRDSLDKAFTGPLATARLVGAQIANAFGFPGTEGLTATRTLIQGLAEMGLSARGMLAGQGAITENEQKLLNKARSGEISFTKSELETLFDIADRAARAQYESATRLLGRAAENSETAKIFLESISPLPKRDQKPAQSPAQPRFQQYVPGDRGSAEPAPAPAPSAPVSALEPDVATPAPGPGTVRPGPPTSASPPAKRAPPPAGQRRNIRVDF